MNEYYIDEDKVYDQDKNVIAIIEGDQIKDIRGNLLAVVKREVIKDEKDEFMANVGYDFVKDRDGNIMGTLFEATDLFPHPDDFIAAALFILHKMGKI